MRELIEALHNLPPKKEKVHTVTIQGQSVVVSLKKKLEVIQQGEDAYMWKTPMEFVLKPRPKIKRGYNILKKSENSITTENCDLLGHLNGGGSTFSTG